MTKFHNRIQEKEYLRNWLSTEPNAMLFVYGPKSSGKSTLMMQVLEGLDVETHIIYYLDLNIAGIFNFESFINTFFQKSRSGKMRVMAKGISINTGFFTISKEDDNMVRDNPFKLMEDILEHAKKNGKLPVIVLDEIKMLKGIPAKGSFFLIETLLNFFIRLTKVRHLAHIVLMANDSCFIEELYSNCRLKKTMELYLVEHFSFPSVQEWLSKEGIDLNVINYIWENLGGSVWEIKQVLHKVSSGISLSASVQYFLDVEYGKLTEFVRTHTTDQEAALLQKVHQEIATNGFALATQYGREINPMIPKMVEHDFWFFRTDTQQITANSESIRWAMKKMAA